MDLKQSQLHILVYLSKLPSGKMLKTNVIARALKYNPTTITDGMIVLRKAGLGKSKVLESSKTRYKELVHSLTPEGKKYAMGFKVVKLKNKRDKVVTRPKPAPRRRKRR